MADAGASSNECSAFKGNKEKLEDFKEKLTGNGNSALSAPERLLNFFFETRLQDKAWGDWGKGNIRGVHQIMYKNNSYLISRSTYNLHVKHHQGLWKQHFTDVIKVLAGKWRNVT